MSETTKLYTAGSHYMESSTDDMVTIPVQTAVFSGIDISEHNGNVDFKKVKAAGTDFVMIREGYGSDGLYPNQVDKFYTQNYTKAKAEGLFVGAYHYLYATTVDGAREEARGFVSNLKGKQFEMPIALDIEDPMQVNLDINRVDAIITTFMNVCEEAGYYCVLYSYESFLTSKISANVRSNYDVWCANISGNPHIACGMHQYSFNGRVDGVNNSVDLNRAFKNYPKIMRNAHKNGY